VAAHLGLILCDAPVEEKIRRKHGIALSEVRLALQWPARAEAAWEDHAEHGPRLVAVGSVERDRLVIAYLLPIPEWDDQADTWVLRTARWL
jgi:uncharacterized DUF497 family protein